MLMEYFLIINASAFPTKVLFLCHLWMCLLSNFLKQTSKFVSRLLVKRILLVEKGVTSAFQNDHFFDWHIPHPKFLNQEIITKEEFPKSDAWHFHNSKSIDPNVPVCQKMFVLKNAGDDDAIHLLLCGCVLYITHTYHDYHPSKG